MNAVLIRALRTYLHAFLGLLIASPLLELDLGSLKALLVAAAPGALSLIQNALEVKTDAPVPRG